MTLAEAVKAYAKHRQFFEDPEVKAKQRELRAAEKVLKAWFRDHPKKQRYASVGCSRSPYVHFVVEAARAALGPKAAEFEEDRERVTLFLIPPKG